MAVAMWHWERTSVSVCHDPTIAPTDLHGLAEARIIGTNLTDSVAGPTRERNTNDGGCEARSESASSGASVLVGD